MKVKKVLCFVFAAVMLFSMAACGQKKEEASSRAAGTENSGNAAKESKTEKKASSKTEKESKTEKTSSKTAKESENGKREPIRIATKPMTEQYILGEMLSILIEENTDYTTEITKGIGGGTNNIHPAMVNGDFDLYPEYTSSGWVMVLKHEANEVSDKEMFELLKKEYSEQFKMSWVGLYGFNNTYAVVVRSDVAKEYNLKTCSDLAAVSDKLIFGGNADYQERADGFPALCETYGYKFKEVVDIDIGLKYTALENKEIDVTNGFTTDAKLGTADVIALEDDKNLQVNYFASTVVREDALEKYPGLEDALMKMDNILTDVEMASLSAKVEAGEDEHDVALEYLKSKGVI